MSLSSFSSKLLKVIQVKLRQAWSHGKNIIGDNVEGKKSTVVKQIPPLQKRTQDTPLLCWVLAQGGRHISTRFKDLGCLTLSPHSVISNSLRSGHSCWPVHLSHLHRTHTVLSLHRDPFIIQCTEKLYPTNHFKVKVKVQLRIHLICEASPNHPVWEGQGHLSLCSASLWHGHYRHVLKHLSLPLNWQS